MRRVITRRTNYGAVGEDNWLTGFIKQFGGDGVGSGKWYRQYVGERNAAGATWGWDNTIGFPVPSVHYQVAEVWAKGWHAAVSKLMDSGEVCSQGVIDQYGEMNKSWAGCQTLIQEYQNRWLSFFSQGLYMIGMDENGILRGRFAENFWQRIFPLASYMDTLPNTDSNWTVMKVTVKEAGKDIAQFVQGGANVLAEAAGETFLAFLKPFLPFVLIGAGGYVVYQTVIKKK